VAAHPLLRQTQGKELAAMKAIDDMAVTGKRASPDAAGSAIGKARGRGSR